MLPAFTVWDKQLGKYKVRFDPALQLVSTGDDQADALANTALFNKVIEAVYQLPQVIPITWYQERKLRQIMRSNAYASSYYCFDDHPYRRIIANFSEETEVLQYGLARLSDTRPKSVADIPMTVMSELKECVESRERESRMV